MAKTTVAAKMVALCEVYVKRINASLRDDEPEVAYFWSVMISSQFSLAAQMLDEGQISPSLFSEINSMHLRAKKLASAIGHKYYMGGSSRTSGIAEAYEKFLCEGEMMGIF